MKSFCGSRLGSYCAPQLDGLIPTPTRALRLDYPPDSIKRSVVFYGVLFGRTHPWDVGSAVCCFERSSLSEHRGERVVVMRLLCSLEQNPVRLMRPPNGMSYPSKLCPQEGELLKVIRGRKVVPWSQNVGALKEKGSSKGIALDILLQNEDSRDRLAQQQLAPPHLVSINATFFFARHKTPPIS